ncbi:MAG: MFS transporter [Chloroflexi bacterium]|nr:MFS transporter [Chloroflexota bacterium]
MFNNRWTILALLVLVRISMGFQFQSVASLDSFLIEDLDLSYGQLGTLIGMFMLPGVFLALPGGFLTRLVGDKRISAFGLAMMAVGAVIMGAGDSYSVELTGRLVAGIGAVLFNVVVVKMVTDWFADREIVTALGVIMGSWPAGIALGLATQNALADTASWQVVMFLAGAMSIVGALLITLLYRAAPVAGSAQERATGIFSLSAREFWLATAAGLTWATFNMGFTSFFSFAPGTLVDRGISPIEATALVSIGVWITVVSVPLGGFLTERLGRPYSATVLFTILSGLMLALFPFLPFALLLTILFGLAIGPPPGAITAMPSRIAGRDNLGPVLGVFFTWHYAGNFIGPVIAGFSRDLTNSAAAPLIVGVLFFATVPLFVGIFLRFQKAREQGFA